MFRPPLPLFELEGLNYPSISDLGSVELNALAPVSARPRLDNLLRFSLRLSHNLQSHVYRELWHLLHRDSTELDERRRRFQNPTSWRHVRG